MPTDKVIDMIMSGKHTENAASEEIDDYPEKLQRAAVSRDVPEWVRRAAQRIVALSERQGIAVDEVSYEAVGLGLHDNIVESAVIGTEGERFFKIVMNFEEAIKNMGGD
mgnify:CR=1 FL=1